MHPVEEYDADAQKHCHEGEAVGQASPTELAGAEHAVFEGFDDGGERVEAHGEVEFGVGDGAQWPYYGCGVHPEADEVVEHQLEVAVFGRHAREEDAEAQRQSGEH